MQIIYKKVNDLIPYINNPRKNDDAVDKVASSIKHFGFKVPIVIDNQNEVVAGHTRLKAAKKLGMDEVPCIVADDLDDNQVKAFRLADNKVSEAAAWDNELLGIEMFSINDIDLTEFGFDEKELQFLDNEKEVIEDNYEIEVPKESKSKLGDLWLLDEHRLLCGDSTKDKDVALLMNNEKADMVFTDPPYGMKKENDGVLNDNLNYQDLLSFNKLWIPLSFKYNKDIGSWYCWGMDQPLMDIYSDILKPMIKENKITFRNLITWDKGSGQGQNSELTRSYAIADEKCIFVMGGVQGFNNNQDNYYEGWESIRLYLNNEMEKVGNRKDWAKALGNQMGHHYFTKSQWIFPTQEAYSKLQQYASSKAFLKEYEELKKEYEELKKEWYKTRSYFDNTHDNMNNVWHFNRTTTEERKQTGGHATPKPLDLCARAIKSSSTKNDIVLDLFGGSGSTLIASEQLNRKCYMLELSPQYIDVIVKRYKTFKPNANIKLIRNTKDYTFNEIFEGVE